MSDVRVPPQPPWVWGPSEVNAWIRAAYPSGARPPPRRRPRKAPRVHRLRIHVHDAMRDEVRDGIVEGLAVIGYRVERAGPHRVEAVSRTRRAVASFHHSVLWKGVVGSIRFEPPIHRAASRHLLHLFVRRFHVVNVTADEA